MAEPEITKDTPIDAVKDNRAYLVRLARTVFDRMETGAMRAFSQFQKSGDIIRLIEAERAGTFHYGEHVKQTPTGWTWPSADDALKMLEAAEKVGTTQPAQAQAPAEQKATTARRAAAQVAAQPAEPQEKVSTTPAPPVDATAFIGPIRESIDGLRDDLRDAFVKLDGRTSEKLALVSDRITGICRGCMGLVGAVEVLMARQKVIAQYLDEHAELPELTEEMKKDLVQFMGSPSEPVQAMQEQAPAEATQAAVPAARRPRATPAKEQPVQEQPAAPAQQEPANGHAAFNYTKEQLTEIGNKDINQLRALAEQVGVPNANAIPFVQVLVARIESFRQKAASA